MPQSEQVTVLQLFLLFLENSRKLGRDRIRTEGGEQRFQSDMFDGDEMVVCCTEATAELFLSVLRDVTHVHAPLI